MAKGRKAQRRALCSTRAGTCVKCGCSFPLKRGKRWSFIPSSPAGPRDWEEATSCSALPLPPLLSMEPLQAHPGWDKAPRPARGWGGEQLLLGDLTPLLGNLTWGLWGLQPQVEVTSPTNWVVGAELGPAGAQQVLVLSCLHTLPHQCPWINIPGSLQPCWKLGDPGACQSQEGGLELTGAVPRGTEPL